jgi:hypothetical protein
MFKRNQSFQAQRCKSIMCSHCCSPLSHNAMRTLARIAILLANSINSARSSVTVARIAALSSVSLSTTNFCVHTHQRAIAHRRLLTCSASQYACTSATPASSDLHANAAALKAATLALRSQQLSDLVITQARCYRVDSASRLNLAM